MVCPYWTMLHSRGGRHGDWLGCGSREYRDGAYWAFRPGPRPVDPSRRLAAGGNAPQIPVSSTWPMRTVMSAHFEHLTPYASPSHTGSVRVETV